MEFVKVPLNIAQRAARAYHPMLPYVRKFIAERRSETKEELTEVTEVPVESINSLTKAELLKIAESLGKTGLEKLKKQEIIERISE